MKAKSKYINLLALLLFLVSGSSCTDYDVKGDSSFYDDVTIEIAGIEDNILRLNYFNPQQIKLAVTPEDLIFDMKAFIYTVENTDVLTVDVSGNIEPVVYDIPDNFIYTGGEAEVDLGTTNVGIVFRANDKVSANTQITIWRYFIPVEGIRRTTATSVKIDETYDIHNDLLVVPADADRPKLAFESLTPELVSVDEKGILTGIEEGDGSIRIRATDGSGVVIDCPVVVIPKVYVSTIEIPAAFNNVTVGAGQTIALGSNITVLPSNADIPELSYEVISGTGVASIDQAGNITTLSPGTAVIRVSSTDRIEPGEGENIFIDVTLTVDDSSLLFRGFWTVTTQTATDYGYVVDGQTGMPEHLFDNKATTFLSLVKPNKTYGGVPRQPADFIPSFTIDMQSQQTFNHILWRHRGGNNNNFLRVYAIEMEGSNDGENFIPISNGMVWIPNAGGYVGSVTNKADANNYTVDIPESTYRYVKVKLVMWSDIYNSQHPDYPGAGATGGSTMQVAEFGLGKQ